ncbi:MAG: ferrous iron transport protein B [Oscillospiraceae bacterium]|nr:ferrous iron transport protein B [Oscillospiraceae bacterium]
MGLTKSSVGIKAIDSGLEILKQTENDKVVAIAGNPNVGKSTVFNNLTGLNQHTGNWPGKTVSNAQGYCSTKEQSYVLVDIPGTYSLMAHSAEEEVARNFICFGEPDAVVVVCDATCLERNLNLVLQTIEISDKVLVCVNLMDEAKRKNICIDLKGLSEQLGVPVVGTIARKKKSLDNFTHELDKLVTDDKPQKSYRIRYTQPIEEAISIIEPVLKKTTGGRISERWLSLKLLDYDESLNNELIAYFDEDIIEDEEVKQAVAKAKKHLADNGINETNIKDRIVSCIVLAAEEICMDTVKYDKCSYNCRDKKIDKILTSKYTGYPIMILLLLVVFWLTIAGANYPSELIGNGLFWLQDKLYAFFVYINAPSWLSESLILGVYRVVAWVVSVMLPPMAIFFPLFTLLEDAGYLPRIAYNLDKPFKKCNACGKQSLTMAMGFGCNAAGIVGCRIIDSPRERLIAMITNNFVPCNGRFPTLIAIISMFFIGSAVGAGGSVLSAVLLTGVIILGVFMTFITSRLLSKTILKGMPSSYTLELPPYRKPQIGKVIVRSIFDRTLFVLGRAVVVAAPAGLVIWLMANIEINDISLLRYCADFLDPFASLLGLDGVILMAFILGLPANEIVVPIIIMAYMSEGSILEFDKYSDLKALLVENGWTWITAVSVMLFSLMHWPCSTTLMTIKKETGSWKWTGLSMLIPTVCGIVICFVFNTIASLI